jgi:GINS complex subunit 2
MPFSFHDTKNRKIGASREQTRKERDAEDAENGYAASSIDDQADDMLS